ncbi:OmpA family protein [Shewanella donghaensis]|uniref:OmpA family protein n=1 Tax=Shewanella donghaensis TaxID=238836 RepID=UPI0011844A62|nr:OmpA family protein [Shewanella donghaensis]
MKYTYLISACLASLLLTACIDTPKPAWVEQQTRDLTDTDTDGVIAARDLCLTTPDGSVISNDGCERTTTTDKRASRVVMFEFDKHQLTRYESERLAKMVDAVKHFPDAKIYLIGDTSPEGSDAYNHQLAQKRAAEITRLIVNQGVEQQQITTQTYDESNMIPAAMNGREHRLVAVAKWQESGVEKAWHIFTTEKNNPTY